MPIGRLARYNSERGFGWVRADSENTPDVFIHVSRLKLAGINNPKVGDPIVYETGLHKGRETVLSCEALKTWQVEVGDTSDD
jgi:cold shock CspA family protein